MTRSAAGHRLYVCAGGCVHLETRHMRISLTRDEFLERLRAAAAQTARASDGRVATTDQHAGPLGRE